ncbi:hypothetical protein [Burkholderia gladioli]|uniref:hypothetical protein n=1 Tax=Burkholderia gladioli TaxID=28095 RepID=UPI003D24CCFD
MIYDAPPGLLAFDALVRVALPKPFFFAASDVAIAGFLLCRTDICLRALARHFLGQARGLGADSLAEEGIDPNRRYRDQRDDDDVFGHALTQLLPKIFAIFHFISTPELVKDKPQPETKKPTHTTSRTDMRYADDIDLMVFKPGCESALIGAHTGPLLPTEGNLSAGFPCRDLTRQIRIFHVQSDIFLDKIPKKVDIPISQAHLKINS